MRLGAPDTGDGLDVRENRIREHLLVRFLDEREDIRLPPTCVGLTDTLHIAEGRDDVPVLARLDRDEDLRGNHGSLPSIRRPVAA